MEIFEEKSGEKTKALLRLGYTCNNNCFFCHSYRTGAEKTDLETEECERRIALAAKAGAGTVVFSGGEPTIRKDILHLCRYAKSIGLKSGIITNGRMLGYKGFSEKLHLAGLNYALVSLHGDNEETHDLHVGTSAFGQTLAGLAEISRLPVSLVVNTVLTKLNSDRLENMLDVVSKFAPLRWKISLPEPRGAILSRMNLILSPNDASRAVKRLLSVKEPYSGVSLGFDGFTPCLLEDYFSLNDDFFTHGFSMVWYADEDRFYTPDRGSRSRRDSCLLCSNYEVCPGIYSEYFSEYPDVELKPCDSIVPENIIFELRSENRNDGLPCDEPFMSVSQPARWMALEEPGKTLMFQTQEKQTDSIELRILKNCGYQIFENQSKAAAGFDSPTGIKTFRRKTICIDCPKEPSCPGLFEYDTESDSTDSFDWEQIENICGRACVVGRREDRITRGIIRKLSDSADVSYISVIDASINLKTQNSENAISFYNVDFENFRLDGDCFDHVVFVVAFNSIADMTSAVATLDSITKTGSCVTIIEKHKRIYLDRNSDYKKGEECEMIPRCLSMESASKLLSLIGFKETKQCSDSGPRGGYWLLSSIKQRGSRRNREF